MSSSIWRMTGPRCASCAGSWLRVGRSSLQCPLTSAFGAHTTNSTTISRYSAHTLQQAADDVVGGPCAQPTSTPATAHRHRATRASSGPRRHCGIESRSMDTPAPFAAPSCHSISRPLSSAEGDESGPASHYLRYLSNDHGGSARAAVTMGGQRESAPARDHPQRYRLPPAAIRQPLAQRAARRSPDPRPSSDPRRSP